VKLLFNGCSFVAGDALTWHIHYPDIDPDLHIWERRPHPRYSEQDIKMLSDRYWRELRPRDNLAAQVSKLTGLEAIDISADGNSNRSIALSTIAYISEHPGDYWVCTGWTEPTRRTVWDPTADQWININLHRLQDPRMPRTMKDAIEHQLIRAPEQDHILDYATSLITLNSWIEGKVKGHTQWRSMGPHGSVSCLDQRSQYGVALPSLGQILDSKNWLGHQDQPWAGPSWFSQLSDSDVISPTNWHPNLQAVERQAQLIADKIRQTA
jgi:hypothetical protein